MAGFVPLENPSPFRKMAAVMWPRPKEPLIFGSLDVDITKARRLMERYREVYGVKLTITHFVIKAFALALRRHPETNAKVHWGRILLRKSVDIFVQVASDGGQDLSGSKLERVDEMTLKEIGEALQKDARSIRSGQDKRYAKSRNLFKRLPGWLLWPLLRISSFLVNELHIDLSKGGMPLDPFGSMMITNVGMFGVEMGWAPFPSVARCPLIVVMSEIKDRPWVEGDRVVVRPVLRMCGTFDHRVIDGFHAGKLSREIHTFFENPEELLTEAERVTLTGSHGEVQVETPERKG